MAFSLLEEFLDDLEAISVDHPTEGFVDSADEAAFWSLLSYLGSNGRRGVCLFDARRCSAFLPGTSLAHTGAGTAPRADRNTSNKGVAKELQKIASSGVNLWDYSSTTKRLKVTYPTTKTRGRVWKLREACKHAFSARFTFKQQPKKLVQHFYKEVKFQRA